MHVFTRVCDSPTRRFVCFQPHRQPSAKARTISQRCARGHTATQQGVISRLRNPHENTTSGFLLIPVVVELHTWTSLQKSNHQSRRDALTCVRSARAVASRSFRGSVAELQPGSEVLRPPGAAQTAPLVPLWRLEADGGGAQRGRARVGGNAWATYFHNEWGKIAQRTPPTSQSVYSPDSSDELWNDRDPG